MTKEVILTVPATYIAVLKLFTANRDIRYYLNGISIEVTGTEARLIATDGHRVGVFRAQVEQPVAQPLTDVIIPNELLAGIKPKGVVAFIIGPKENGTNSRSVRVHPQCDEYAVTGKTIDGRYPDWRRVIPCEVSGEAAQFNPNFIGDLGKASRYLHGKGPFSHSHVGIGHNGDRGALIDLGKEEFVGVLMPMRGDKPHSFVPPAWALDAAPIETREAA